MFPRVEFTETEMTQPCTVCGKPRNQCDAAREAIDDGFLIVVPNETEES